MTAYWLFAALVACLVIAVVWSTLRSGSVDETDDAVRLDGALEALRSLEFERETGKLSDGEYRRLRVRLEAEALRARDAAGSDRPGAGGSGAGSSPPRPCAACGRPLEGRERFCPSCGREVSSRAAGRPDSPASG